MVGPRNVFVWQGIEMENAEINQLKLLPIEHKYSPHSLFFFFFMLILGQVRIRLAPQGQERGLVSASQGQSPPQVLELKKKKTTPLYFQKKSKISGGGYICSKTQTRDSPKNSPKSIIMLLRFLYLLRLIRNHHTEFEIHRTIITYLN